MLLLLCFMLNITDQTQTVLFEEKFCQNTSSTFLFLQWNWEVATPRSFLMFISIVFKLRKEPVFLSLTNRCILSNWKERALRKKRHQCRRAPQMLMTGKNEVHRADCLLKKQAALRDKILHKPLQTNNHSEKVGRRGKKYSCHLWFAGRIHRLTYFLQTKHLAQMHLNKTIKSFPHFQK